MGQEKSRPLYGNVHHDDESPTGARILNDTSIEEIPYADTGNKGSHSGRKKDHHALIDINFASKRYSSSSAGSSMSDDSLRDDTFRHVLEPLYEKSVSYYQKMAQNGDAFGAYYIGLAYENGFGGFSKNLTEACNWYNKSSQKGFILAEHAHQRVSAVLAEEHIVEKVAASIQARVELLLRAALQGHRQAGVRLKLLCDKEKSALRVLRTKRSELERNLATKKAEESCEAELLGTLGYLIVFLEAEKDNYDDVIELFRRAADLGNHDASYAVGKLYLRGHEKGHAANETLATKYLTLAADHGQLMAQIELGKYFLRKSQAHVGNEKYEAKAYRYFEQAADQGSAEGWLNVAHQYLYGEVIENDVTQAIECLERAAVTVDYMDSGRSNSRALCVLGRIYRYGISEVATDYDKAVGFFTESANRKFQNACLELGKMYARGKGVNQDVSRGKTLLESVHSFSESQYQLARIYELRLNDSKTADKYYKDSMKGYSRDVAKHRDYTIGLYRIAKMYEYGRGTPKDAMKAKAFYYRATTSAEKTYILWWKGYGDKAFRRLADLQLPDEKTQSPANKKP